MSKTLFIPVFQSFVSRNILNTGILDELLVRGAKVVLFVPPAKKDFYKSVYNRKNIFIETFDADSGKGKREQLFKSLSLLLVSTNAMRFRKIKMKQTGGGTIKYLYQRSITAVFGNIKLVKRVFRWFDFNFNNPDAFVKYFEKYSPHVVFSPDVFGAGDIFILKSAKKHGVRTVGMVASWDNNTTKGLMRLMPDVLVVQNEIIKEESVKIQTVPESIIRVSGIAHYDYYKGYKPIPREDFFKKLGGIPPKKKLVLFSPAGDKFISTDWQICEILRHAIEKGELPQDIIIIIRIHPTNPVNLDKFKTNENFIIEKPGISFANMGDKKNELDKESLHHLLDTLHHSELVINVVSSLVIDAAVLDKPVITIGFEGWESRVPFGSSVKRYHSDENMAKLLAIGGTPIVKNEKELIEQINTYLKYPEKDKSGREKIVEKQCWRLDGKAKFRIADVIMSNN
ncbi:MAG: CDP-glycerol glycerophosphotransferase family protein [Crocinitomicaceae bacterium]